MGLVTAARGIFFPAVLMFVMAVFFGVLMTASGPIEQRPRIKIDDDGISTAEWQWIKIAWRDIRDVQVVGVNGEGTVVMLEVQNEEQYRQQLSRLIRWSIKFNSFWRGGFFGFSVEWLNVPKQDVIAEVRHRAGVDPQGRPSFRFGNPDK
jgi:hypothetical protein